MRTPDEVARGRRRGGGVAAPSSASWSRSASCSRASLLDAVPLGFVNVHFSLLPRWRGAAPVERAILAGDAETGVCIMALEAGLDTGPVYARAAHADRRRRRPRASCARGSSSSAPSCCVDTLPTGRRRTTRAAGRRAHLRRQAHGRRVPARLGATGRRARPVVRPATRARRVDHRRRPRLKVWRAHRCRRASTPSRAPCSGTRRVATGDGALELVEVQPEGSRAHGRERVAAPAAAATRSDARHVSRPRRRDHARRRARRARAHRRRRVRARRAARDAARRRTSTTATARSPPTSSTARCAAQRRLDDLLGSARRQRPARPARPAGARRAAPRRVPAAARRPAARRGRRDGRRARRPLAARAGFVNGVLRALTRLGRAVARAGRATRSRSRTPTGSSRASPPSSAPSDARAALVAMNEPRGGHAAARTRARVTPSGARRRAARSAGARGRGGPPRRRRAARARHRRSRSPRPRCATAGPRRRTRPARRWSRCSIRSRASAIADVAAAPGGKATAIAERVGERRLGGRRSTSTPGGCASIDSARRPPRACPIVCPVVADGRDLPVRRRRLRPGAARRAVQRHRRAPPSARRPLAPAARRDRRAGRAPARPARAAAAASCARAACSSTPCARSRATETVGVDEWAAAAPARLRRARAAGRAVASARPRRAPPPARRRHRRHVRPRPPPYPLTAETSGRGG